MSKQASMLYVALKITDLFDYERLICYAERDSDIVSADFCENYYFFF